MERNRRGKSKKPTVTQFAILTTILECAHLLAVRGQLTHNQARNFIYNRTEYFNIPTSFLPAIALTRGCSELLEYEEESPSDETVLQAKAQDPEGAAAGVVYLPEEVPDKSKLQQANEDIRHGLNLMKLWIGAEQTQQNMDLHAAVQLIVLGCRRAGLLAS